MPQCGLSDPGLLGEELGSCLHGGLKGQRLQRHRAAMYPAQQPLAFQRDEILADRFPGHPERLGDLHRVDAAVAVYPIENVVLALVGIRCAGVWVISGHNR